MDDLIMYNHSTNASTNTPPRVPRPPPDTAINKSISHTFTGTRTKAAEVSKMIKDDISAGNCHVADTSEFLNRLFPVPSSVVEDVYENLVKSQSYDPRCQKWKDIPKDSIIENEYYKPFVAAAESIRQAHASCSNATVSLSCMWIDRHSKSPISRDQNASLIRPDVLCVLGMKKDEYSQWEALIHNQDKEKQLQAVIAWWLRVNVVVEIKPTDCDNLLKDAEQLFGYMRQVLREQADRRFVPGLLLTRTRLHVWIGDRSGVLGTLKPFDIHKDPRAFIQIIIACSLLPPARLGWDPTMRLCRYPINLQNMEFLHSYDPRITLADYGESLYHTHWVITMPAKDNPKIREEYMTVRALSVVRAESMSGRATIVWAVIKVEDMKTSEPPHKIYVLKQCWRPTTGTNEGELFPTEMDNIQIGRLHSFEDVLQDGAVVDTHKFIRGELVHVVPPVRTHTNVNGKREIEALVDAQDREKYITLDVVDDRSHIPTNNKTHPIWRIAARMLFVDYGWPLRYFRDMLELVKVLRDTVTAHRLLYLLYRTLHRDISIGNVLICPGDVSCKATGRLIDLDYAKRATTVIEKDEIPPPKLVATIEDCFFFAGASSRPKLSPDVAQALWKANTQFQTYVPDLMKYKPSLQDKEMLCREDIGVLEENIPDFGQRTAENPQRSATFPFASAEVLSMESIFRGSRCVHDAVHDLEAFFWVLTSICLTRDGPGGKRRKELERSVEPTPETQRLRLLNYCFFSSIKVGELACNKKELFRDDDYEESIVPHFHPYFKRLEPLLLQWWKILRFAHRYPVFKAVHDDVLNALTDMISDLENNPPTTHPESGRVDEFRRLDLESLQYFPRKSMEDYKKFQATWDLSPMTASRENQGSAGGEYDVSPPPSPTPLPKGRKKRKTRK